ncbi:hypothetical protein CLOP_g16138 [Closterium sp. NIES-67]|nr:hypothetical protein CLOP_g16138 [Closterium sp. NIES-67]
MERVASEARRQRRGQGGKERGGGGEGGEGEGESALLTPEDSILNAKTAERLLERLEAVEVLRRSLAVFGGDWFRLGLSTYKSHDLPAWWRAGIHDKGLVKGIFAHGYGSWAAIMKDHSLPFAALIAPSKGGRGKGGRKGAEAEPSGAGEGGRGGSEQEDEDGVGGGPVGEGAPKSKVLVRRLKYLEKMLRRQLIKRDSSGPRKRMSAAAKAAAAAGAAADNAAAGTAASGDAKPAAGSHSGIGSGPPAAAASAQQQPGHGHVAPAGWLAGGPHRSGGVGGGTGGGRGGVNLEFTLERGGGMEGVETGGGEQGGGAAVGGGFGKIVGGQGLGIGGGMGQGMGGGMGGLDLNLDLGEEMED